MVRIHSPRLAIIFSFLRLRAARGLEGSGPFLAGVPSLCPGGRLHSSHALQTSGASAHEGGAW